MQQSPLEDLQNKDFWTSLALWLGIEIISFVIFPILGLINPGERIRIWFLTSIPLGLGGAFLISASSRFLAGGSGQRATTRSSKSLAATLGQFGGGIGLAGILYPFVMVIFEYMAKATQG
jgi:hypothetical protein